MHEGAIAESIVDILRDVKKDNDLEKITYVKLRVGIFSGVMVDALMFAIDALKNEEDFIADTKFEVEEVDVKARCVLCGRVYRFDKTTEVCFLCPQCNMPLEIESGKEMEIAVVEGE